MGIRKRKWPCKKCAACVAAPRDKHGKIKGSVNTCTDIGEAWVVDYASQERDEETGRLKRHIKTFPKKKDAENWAAQTHIDVGRGTHTPASRSITVEQAGKRWIDSCTGLEPS